MNTANIETLIEQYGTKGLPLVIHRLIEVAEPNNFDQEYKDTIISIAAQLAEDIEKAISP